MGVLQSEVQAPWVLTTYSEGQAQGSVESGPWRTVGLTSKDRTELTEVGTG